MAKMIVSYRQPRDAEQFLRHYHEVHVPLAVQLPSLISYEISEGPIVSPGGGEVPFLVGVLTFPSMEALREAFTSEIGQKCAADRKALAPEVGDSSMVIFDTRDLCSNARA